MPFPPYWHPWFLNNPKPTLFRWYCIFIIFFIYISFSTIHLFHFIISSELVFIRAPYFFYRCSMKLRTWNRIGLAEKSILSFLHETLKVVKWSLKQILKCFKVFPYFLRGIAKNLLLINIFSISNIFFSHILLPSILKTPQPSLKWWT